MKKTLIALTMAAAIAANMCAPAFACTPILKPTKVPTIPDLSNSIRFELPDSVLDAWLQDHPIGIT